MRIFSRTDAAGPDADLADNPRAPSCPPATEARAGLRTLTPIPNRSAMIPARLRAALLVLSSVLLLPLAGCGTVRAIANLEDGAGSEAGRVWDRWVDSRGDIAVAVTWDRKVAPGVTLKDIEQAFASVAAEHNFRPVGELAVSRELEARTGQPQRLIKVFSYCNPSTARQMLDFSPHMAAFLPCRITVVEQDDGLWLYTLNMDMMIRMGRKLPPQLKHDALLVREAVWQMMERGAKGEF